MFDRLSVEKKNKIGMIGFAVLLLTGSAYGGYKYWQAGAGARLAKTTLTGLTPDQFRQQLGALDLSKMTLDQRDALADHAMDYMRDLSGDERRKFWGGDDAASRNFRALGETKMTRVAVEYIRADPAKKVEILDHAIDDMQDKMKGWQQRAATQPAGGGGRGPGGGGGGPGGGKGGQRNPANMMRRAADRMASGDPQARAAGAEFGAAMQARAAQRGIPMPNWGGGGR